MAFSLKKFISFFLEPFTFGFLILLLAFIFLFFNSYKKAKVFLFIGLMYFFLVSSSIFSNLLMSPLENKYKNQEDIDISKIEYILLLGGDFKARFDEVVKLSKEIQDAKIITSGYEGSRIIPEAIEARDRLISYGITNNRIIIQEKPKDTIEEAISIKKLLKDKPFILVTSASHMPRAMEIFKQQGLNPIAMPTAFTIKENRPNSYLSIGNIKKVHMAVHEYLGLIWFKIKTTLNK
ncbi:MAG: YdcF family protein [Arcobacter sp.]|uniref:YdcF family protein n=1 Tax=Arcobacter sp. TaxID=1872629 RepID=UPI003B00A7E0